jgi:hypothetical protein
LVPSIAVLGHGLLHPLRLWLFRFHPRLLSPDVRVRHFVCADAPTRFPALFVYARESRHPGPVPRR